MESNNIKDFKNLDIYDTFNMLTAEKFNEMPQQQINMHLITGLVTVWNRKGRMVDEAATFSPMNLNDILMSLPELNIYNKTIHLSQLLTEEVISKIRNNEYEQNVVNKIILTACGILYHTDKEMLPITPEMIEEDKKYFDNLPPFDEGNSYYIKEDEQIREFRNRDVRDTLNGPTNGYILKNQVPQQMVNLVFLTAIITLKNASE